MASPPARVRCWRCLHGPGESDRRAARVLVGLGLGGRLPPLQARRTPCRAGAAAGAGLVAQDPAPGRLARIRDPPHRSPPCRSGCPACLPRTGPRDEARGRWPWPSEVRPPRGRSGPSPGLSPRPRQPRPGAGPAFPGLVDWTTCEVDGPGLAEVRPPWARSGPPPDHGPRSDGKPSLVPGRPSSDLSVGEATTSVPLPLPNALSPQVRSRPLPSHGRAPRVPATIEAWCQAGLSGPVHGTRQ